MPFYRFVCPNCEREEKKLLSKEDADKFMGACILCGTVLVQTMGSAEGRSVETADEYHDKKVVSGTTEALDQRAHDHFVKHDLPRIIAEHGMEYAKKLGFVDEDGHPK